MRAPVLFVSAVLSLSLVDISAGLTQIPAAPSQHAETAIVNQPFYPAGYLDLKIAAVLAEQDETLHFEDEIEALSPGDEINLDYLDLSSCFMDFNIEVSDPVEQLLERTARTVARVTSILIHAGYDPRIFEQPLLDYESHILTLAPETLAEPSYDLPQDHAEWVDFYEFRDRLGLHYSRLVAELERRRAAIQSDRRRIAQVAECGGGEVSYIIQTNPPNGRVWMVPMFRFLVCSRRFPDPWDRRSCSWWREYHADQPSYPWGRYMYQMQWPDGASTRGDRTFDPLPQGPDQGTVIVNLRRN